MLKIGQVENSDADSNGEFNEGDPLKSVSATRVKADWLNSLQRELVNLVEGLNLKLDPNNDKQLSQRLRELTPLRHEGAIPNHHCVSGFAHYPYIVSKTQRLELIQHGAWKIEIDRGQIFNWRGTWNINTGAFSESERSFDLAPSATYHLRWQPSDGFLLFNLNDVTYNPQGLAESSAVFDTTFDDMLIAKIITDEQGITEIITFRNTQRLLVQWLSNQPSKIQASSTGAAFYDSTSVANLSLQWSRTPCVYWQGVSGLDYGSNYRASLGIINLYNRCRFGVRATREEALLYDSYERGQADQPTWHYVLRA